MPDQEIKFILTASGAAKVETAMAKVGKQAETMGKKTESARLAAWGMGENLEGAARKMGVPTAVARKLGDTVESLTMRMGKSALAFGAVGLAGMALYGVVTSLTESYRQWREEIIKAGASAEQWLETQYKDERQTARMNKLYKERLEIKKDQARHDLRQKLYLDEDTLIQNQRKLNVLTAEYNKMRAGKGDDASTGYAAIAEHKKRETIEQLERQIRATKNDIEIEKERLKQSAGEKSSKPSKDEQAAVDMENRAYAARKEDEYERQIAAARNAFDKAQAEQRAKDRETEQREEERIYQIRLQTGRNALNALVQGYALAGQHSIKAFHRYKQLAKLQAGISTAEGAIAAYKAMSGIPVVGPALGAEAAAALVFYGKQQIDAIDSAVFGAAPAAAPAYAANPATGLPSGGDRERPLNLTLVINGETRQIGELTEDVVRELYNSNGAIGGLSVAVERSI